MVTDAFGILLDDLSRVINIRDLHPDSNNSCLIKFPDGLKVQLEIDKHGENLILGVDLGEPDIGRYRENLFREALKSNGHAMQQQHNGIFAYSQRSRHMLLYESISLKEITAEKVANALQPIMDIANVWREAISRGEVPTVQSTAQGGGFGGMFGLR